MEPAVLQIDSPETLQILSGSITESTVSRTSQQAHIGRLETAAFCWAGRCLLGSQQTGNYCD